MPEVLLGRGKAARVYKVEATPYPLTRKEFSPIFHAKLWNWFLYHSPHPLTTENGHKYAYWKRRLAHRLSEYLDCNVRIPDALQSSKKGFILKYIEGHPPKRSDKRMLYRTVRKLENFFESIGMPTWSFSRRNPFSRSNFILKDDIIYIIDYEQSVPVPDSKGRIAYDAIYFDEIHKFITNSRQRILDRLGEHEMRNLEEAFELTRKSHANINIKPKIITKLVNRNKK